MSLSGHLGFFNTSSTRTHVRFQFSTHAAAGGNVAPNSAFEAADLRIYRANDGAAFSATQRSSAAGITMTSPFDSLTGVHDVDIDLTDNTDAGFYAAGYTYSVMLCPDETVDSQTLTGIVLATFEIGVAPVNVTQLGGDAQSLTDLKDFADAGYDPSTNKVQGVVLVDTTTVATDAEADIATLASAVAALNDISATDVWAAGTRTLSAGTNIVLAKGTGVTGFNDLDAAGIRTAVGLAFANLDTQLGDLPTAGENADAVWDEATSGHTTSGTFGEQLKTDVDAILADTNELQLDWVNGGRLDLILDARASQTSVDTIDDLLDTEIAAIQSALAVVDSNVDAILADTGTDGVVVASLGASALDAIHDEPITEPSARPAWASMTHRKLMQTLGVLMLNEVNSDSDSVNVRNDADSADLWAYGSADDGTTYTSGKAA